MAGHRDGHQHRRMVLPSARRSSDSRSDAHDIVRAFLVRPMTGVFLVIPLLGAFLGIGTPSLLMTLGGAAALWLAVDLLLAWMRRPVPAELGAYSSLVAWTAGLGVLAAAGWQASEFAYHGEMVALVGTATAIGVGLGNPRTVTVVWGVAAGAAVTLGTSMVTPLTAESAIAPAAIAVGAWFGAAIGVVVDRIVPATRVRGTREAAEVASGPGASVGHARSGLPARARETRSG
jgi:hypothetical protein